MRFRKCGSQHKLRSDSASAGRQNPLREHMQVVGTATVVAGGAVVFDVRLPPDWEK